MSIGHFEREATLEPNASKKNYTCMSPQNVLLKHPTKSSIKVIDFGSSCLENEKVYTYIQSRFYRSPEVILGMSYNMAIDMWSLGCILAELYTGYPLFPGENEQEQLTCIMEIQGVPERYLIEKSSRKKLFFGEWFAGEQRKRNMLFATCSPFLFSCSSSNLYMTNLLYSA